MKKTLSVLLGAASIGLISPVTAQGKSMGGEVLSMASVQQNKTVKGRVLDANGEPVIGASILEKGTTNGTITDLDGNFQLNVKNNAILQVSFIGYASQEIVVKSATVTVTLKEDTELLEEVVVLGYGAGQRKQDLSASVGVLKNTDDLVARPVTSTEGMLQGQIAGVTVQANGGDPTSAPNIVIRGQGSQNGDNVLWVVDGVPGAPIASMNDIESIVVLKDAASAAIYGAQSGAGGVVLVTTKKAKEGAPSLSYDGTYGIRRASNLIEPLNAEEQVAMRKESYKNAGVPLPSGWDVTKNPYVGTTRTNWMDEIFRTAFYQRHNVALNVGTENYSNRLSFSYDDDQGVLINTFNKNLALRYNGKFKLNKWATISEDLVWKNNKNRSKATDEGHTGAVISAIMMPSSAEVYNPLDGTYGGTVTEDPEYINKYGNFAGIHGDVVNPVRMLETLNANRKTTDLWSTTSLEIANIIPGLRFTSRFTYNLTHIDSKAFEYRIDEPGKPTENNGEYIEKYRTDEWKTENTLTYDHTFANKHTVGALFSTTANHMKQSVVTVDGNDFPSEEGHMQYLPSAGHISANEWLIGPDANVSLIARLAYTYDDRYFFTASWRRDYAGRLPKENNYGDFPAVTLGWKISNESFFPKTDAINLLKVRASWGRVGNLGSIGYNYKSPLLGRQNRTDRLAQYGIESTTPYNTVIFNNTALNPNLTWETSEQWDLGLDLALFNNRLDLSLDYFSKRTFNLIQEQTMNWPTSMGIDPMLINQGEVTNKGFEISASWNDKVNKDFSYYVSGNFSYLKNKVSDIGVKNEDGNPGVWTGGGKFLGIPYVYQTAQGQPLNSFYLIHCDGIFQDENEVKAHAKKGKLIQPDAKPGDLRFQDVNDDGVINDLDRQYMGNATPETTFSLSGGITWKKLSVNAMLQGVGGAQALYVGKYRTLNDADKEFNRDREILNAWSPTNKESNIPRLSKNDPNNNFTTPSDWYLEDASYLRLKNLTVSYDLTDQLRKWVHLKERNSTMSVYVSGENLFTITDYSGMDPECGGWDALRYPLSRVFSFGVKLTY